MEIILNNFIYQAFYPLLIPFDRFAPILIILLVPSAAFSSAKARNPNQFCKTQSEPVTTITQQICNGAYF